MRFFCGEPIWTPYNRALAATDQRPARGKYIERFLKGKVAQKRKQGRVSSCSSTQLTLCKSRAITKRQQRKQEKINNSA